MKTKRTVCLCLALCLMLSFVSLIPMTAFADAPAAGRNTVFGQYVLFLDNVRENPNNDGFSKTIYTSGDKDRRLYTAKGLERYSPTDSGYGVKLFGAEHDDFSGVWGLNLRDWSYTASTQLYFSIHYQVKGATNTGMQTAADTTNIGGGSQEHLLLSMDVQNDVWKTYTIKVADHMVGGDKKPIAAPDNWPTDGCDFLGLALPALEGEGAYYVIDYVGFFASEEDAANEAEYWEAFHSGVTLPNAAQASVASGTYYEAQTVTLTCADSSAEIYYTLDGSKPTKASTRYTAPIAVEESVTLKAVAYNPAQDVYSPATTYIYDIVTNLVAPPEFDLGGGCIPAGKSLTITCKTAGATIHYTTDGTDPTADSPVYTAPISIEGAVTVKAIAVKAGMDNSSVASVEFSNLIAGDIYWMFSGLEGGSADKTFTQLQGVWHNNWFEAIFCGEVTNDELGGIVIPATKDRENAIRIEGGYLANWKELMPNGYHRYLTLTYKCPVALELEYHPDHYNNGARSQKIPLAAANEYTTVVIDLWENSPEWVDYVGASNVTIQFYCEGETTVSVLSASFHETREAAEKSVVLAPSASLPTSDTYTDTISVELASATDGAKIYYTLDGSDPTAATGTLYTGAISISKDTVVKAIAVKEGSKDSFVVTFAYKVTLTVAAPSPDLANGKYDGNQTVTVTCPTEGAKIYYTLDGSTPSAENGTLYTGPITLTKSCILKLIGVMEGRENSKVVSRTYNIAGGSENTGDTGTGEAPAQSTEQPSNEQSGGCSSAIGASTFALLAVVFLAGVVVCKVKKEQ